MSRVLKILYSSDFQKAYRKLPKRIQNAVDKRDAMFRFNPFNKSLKTHKLHGPLNGFWAFSITREYRVLFEFIENGAAFYDVGTHEIYK